MVNTLPLILTSPLPYIVFRLYHEETDDSVIFFYIHAHLKIDMKSFSASFQAKQVQYERSDEFLTMMKAGPVENFLRFRYILLKNNQTEVANMLSEFTSHSRQFSF